MRCLGFCAALACASAAAADPLDAGSYPVVYRAPGTERVVVRKDVPFAVGDRTLHFDLYLPPGRRAGPLPVVVFANGVGDRPGAKLKDWTIYRSWARLVAARGHAAVVAESDAAAIAPSLRGLFAALAADGARLGLDPARIAVWACSANVAPALPLVMDDAPPGIRAAVFYYGNGSPKRIRTDLPVLHVLAGRDGQGLLDAERALRAAAAAAHAPWTMIEEPTLPHAFDALDPSEASRRTIALTLAFLDAHLGALPPAPPPSRERQIVAAVYGQDLEAAIAGLRPMVAAAPDREDAAELLASVEARHGDCDAAAAHLARVAAPPAFVLGALGRCQLAARRYDDAIAAYGRALAGGGPPDFAYNLACAHALAGHRDQAFAALDEALRRGFADRHLLETDADLASLRADPRFPALLSRLPAR